MTMTTAEEKNDKIQKATEDIESIVQRCSVVALRNEPVLMQTIKMARGMGALRNVLTEGAIMNDFMPLKNTALGFLTDENPDKNIIYDWKTVRECVIEALLRGFRPINNEFNIISGRFYGAKNGYERIVRTWPGLTRLGYDLAVPVMVADKGALVGFVASWIVDGEPMDLVGALQPAESLADLAKALGKTVEELRAAGVKERPAFDSRIPVRVNAGMGPDAILGKAERKMFARIHKKLTGHDGDIIDPDDDMGTVIPTTALPAPADPDKDGKRISMKGNGKKDEAKPAEQQKLVQDEPGSDG
jgi:hypothetical protein